MMLDTPEDVLNIVRELNYELYYQFEGKDGDKDDDTLIAITTLEYRSTGDMQSVMFLGYPLWNSESEEREWDDEKNGYVPDLRTHLIDQIREYTKRLQPLTTFMENK